MFSSTAPTLVAYIMESIQQLDPTLLAFWEGFPCPPPWREELLFRLNWTGCVGLEVGERMRSFMADKCNIRHDGKRILPEIGGDARGGTDTGVIGEEGGSKDGLLVEEECGLPCQIVITIICVLFLILLCFIIVVCVRRHRSKSSSPTHQSALTEHQDGTKYYTSCHYACASVVARQLQASVNGDRTETSMLPVGVTGTNGHYLPGAYPQHGNCRQEVDYEQRSHLLPQMTHHLHHHHHNNHHHHLPHQLINTPYGQMPAQTSSLIVPNRQHHQHHPYSLQQHQLLHNVRKIDPSGNIVYTSCSIGSCSNNDPVYESIGGDSDSARHTSLSEEGYCEYCDCGFTHGDTDQTTTTLLSQGHNMPITTIHSPFKNQSLIHNPQEHGNPFTSQAGAAEFIPSPPCAQSENVKDDLNNLCDEGEYNEDRLETANFGDACSQTLPLRPLKGKPISISGARYDMINQETDNISSKESKQSIHNGHVEGRSIKDYAQCPDSLDDVNLLDVSGGPSIFPRDDPDSALLSNNIRCRPVRSNTDITGGRR